MTTLTLSLSYVALLLILGIVLIFSNLTLLKKALLVFVCAGFYIIHYSGLLGITGWPTREPLPDHFDIISMRAIEPDLKGQGDGKIELWIKTPGTDRSRLHVLPYSKQLHQEVLKAQLRQARGNAQRGRTNRNATGSGAPGSIEIRDREVSKLPRKKTAS